MNNRIKTEYLEALEELEYYISENDYDMIFEWGCRFHDEVDCPKITEKVIEAYTLCMNIGNPDAALNLGTYYYMGRGVKQNYKKAYELYRIAADKGVLRAICNIGYCFYYGRHQPIDYSKAYDYFVKGVLLFDDANCLYKLGDMYLNGLSVEKNEKYAFMLYERAESASEYSESYCTPDIKFRLGICLLYGIGTEIDVPLALENLTDALIGFYQRRKTDSFVGKLISSTKDLIAKATDILDNE